MTENVRMEHIFRSTTELALIQDWQNARLSNTNAEILAELMVWFYCLIPEIVTHFSLARMEDQLT